MDSKYDGQCDDNDVICPYCGNRYQPEAEDFDEDTREEECGECGKTYKLHDSFTVTHFTKPDCELNGEQHKWVPVKLRDGRVHDFCSVCNQCRPIRDAASEED